MKSEPYRILWNFGSEGWSWGEECYGSAVGALYAAMEDPQVPFVIVRLVEFTEGKDGPNENNQG